MYISPSIRIIIDCRLIARSIKEKLYKLKPCIKCLRYEYKDQTPYCKLWSIKHQMVFDITRNVFVNPNCLEAKSGRSSYEQTKEAFCAD